MGDTRSFNMKVLAVCLLILGILFCVVGTFVGLAILVDAAGDHQRLAVVLFAMFFPLSIVLILCSFGLFRRKKWALPLLLISGLGLLIFVPFGTIVGIMALAGYADLKALKGIRQ